MHDQCSGQKIIMYGSGDPTGPNFYSRPLSLVSVSMLEKNIISRMQSNSSPKIIIIMIIINNNNK